MSHLSICNASTGETLALVRDVRHEHPTWVHAQCETETESQLQAMLDQSSLHDYAKRVGQPDSCGILMTRDALDAFVEENAALAEIVAAKRRAGEGAYLWLHSSGDCMLWPDESSSVDDDGRNAIDRWQIDAWDARLLVATGLVDAEA